jgi:hypothetical protein
MNVYVLLRGAGGRGGDAPPSDCHIVKMEGAKGMQPNRRLDRGLCVYFDVYLQCG